MKNGPYELVKAPDDYPGRTYRGNRRYVYEHTLVWWQCTGELPGPDEVVHHKNDSKRDNRFRNLELKTRADHASDHAKRVDPITAVCGSCGVEFSLEPAVYRTRAARNETGEVYCTRACGMCASWVRRRNNPI